MFRRLRARATRAAAPAPNRSTIGGAGTSVPLLVEELPPDDVLLPVEEDVLELVEEEVELLPLELPVEP